MRKESRKAGILAFRCAWIESRYQVAAALIWPWIVLLKGFESEGAEGRTNVFSNNKSSSSALGQPAKRGRSATPCADVHPWITCQRWHPRRRCGRCSCARAARWPGGSRPSPRWNDGRKTQSRARSSLWGETRSEGQANKSSRVEPSTNLHGAGWPGRPGAAQRSEGSSWPIPPGWRAACRLPGRCLWRGRWAEGSRFLSSILIHLAGLERAAMRTTHRAAPWASVCVQLGLLLYSHLRLQNLFHGHLLIHRTGGLHFALSLLVSLPLLLDSCRQTEADSQLAPFFSK